MCLIEITKDQFSKQTSDGISYHPWRIDNKYYCADVQLLVANQDEKPDWLSKKGLEATAVLILFDQIQSSFEGVKEWLPYVQSQDASVVLLVGSKVDQTVTMDEQKQDLSRLVSQVLEFSIKHSFEFVDLNEEVDEEDDFADTVGFDRIVQALQAAEWPSLQMKDQVVTASNSELLNEQTGKHSENRNAEVVSETEFNSLQDMLDGVLDEADLDGEGSFDNLFSQMKLMKEKAESLPHTERKAYAEQVAVAFWKAVGGDEDEIDLDEK